MKQETVDYFLKAPNPIGTLFQFFHPPKLDTVPGNDICVSGDILYPVDDLCPCSTSLQYEDI
jgi:hypothetical protein